MLGENMLRHESRAGKGPEEQGIRKVLSEHNYD